MDILIIVIILGFAAVLYSLSRVRSDIQVTGQGLHQDLINLIALQGRQPIENQSASASTMK